MWNDRRVLVTGANGFLAGWLAKDLIERGALVTALIYERNPVSVFEREKFQKRSHIVYSDILDLNAMRRLISDQHIEVIFHLSAQAICQVAFENPLGTFDANIRGTAHVLEAVRTVDPSIRVIVASSDKAYGIHETLPYREDFALQGEFPYEVSKSCADLISRMYAKTYGLPVCVVRSGNLYGGGDAHFSRVFPKTIHRLHNNLPPILLRDSLRDYLYVEDAVNGYRLIAEAMLTSGLTGEAFNIGHGVPISVREVFNHIAEAMGKINLEIVETSGSKIEIPHQYLDSTKIRALLGWRPSIEIKEGVRRTVDWYVNFLNAHPHVGSNL